MSKFTYHYVYRITNLKEQKHYYGTRSSNNPENDIGIKYFSSSTDIDFISLQKEKPWEFKYKIIAKFDNREKAIKLEIRLHNYFDVGVNSKFYNLSKQTSTGFDRFGCDGPFKNKTHSQNTKKSISKSRIDKGLSAGKNNAMFGKNHQCHGILKRNKECTGQSYNEIYGEEKSNEIRNKMSAKASGENNSFYGKKHSDETKKQISIKNSGKVRTKEARKRISDSQVGKCWFYNKKGETTKMHPNNPRIEEEGWIRGRKMK